MQVSLQLEYDAHLFMAAFWKIYSILKEYTQQVCRSFSRKLATSECSQSRTVAMYSVCSVQSSAKIRKDLLH